jgi:hypothetical protein
MATMNEDAGQCESGAALGCEGVGTRSTLPESMLPGQEAESIIQCGPCRRASAAAYARKRPRYAKAGA